MASGPHRTASSILVAAALLAATVLAGCATSSFRPGDAEETGRTIHLKATVLDLLAAPLYPGLDANLWAFCFKPADPADTVSAAAIEYLPDQMVDVSQPAWQGTCSVPGPTLHVRQGDRVVVDFENQHVHHHTIHWHGQHVPWESDGVPGMTQDSVPAGGAFTYDFIAKRAGTLFYHCHVDTQLHLMQGLYGALIVEPRDTSLEPRVDRDQVLILSTMQRALVENTPARQKNPHIDHQHLGGCGETGRPGCQNPAVDITPDVFLLNGVSFPYTLEHHGALIRLAPGETLRLRLINAGTTFESIHTHGHDFLLTHDDGNPVPPDARVWKDTVTLGPGERKDIVLYGTEAQAGAWVVHTHVTDHVTNDGMYPGGALTAIIYPGYEDAREQFTHEMPGGRPYQEPLAFPPDVLRSERRDVGTTADVREAWTFDVAMTCAVRTLRVQVDVEGPATALNDLAATLTDPDGQEMAAPTFENGTATWTWRRGETPPAAGDYRFTVEGRALETTLVWTLHIDHDDDTAEHQAAGSPCAHTH